MTHTCTKCGHRLEIAPSVEPLFSLESAAVVAPDIATRLLRWLSRNKDKVGAPLYRLEPPASPVTALQTKRPTDPDSSLGLIALTLA
jgi:hypothetical protein